MKISKLRECKIFVKKNYPGENKKNLEYYIIKDIVISKNSIKIKNNINIDNKDIKIEVIYIDSNNNEKKEEIFLKKIKIDTISVKEVNYSIIYSYNFLTKDEYTKNNKKVNNKVNNKPIIKIYYNGGLNCSIDYVKILEKNILDIVSEKHKQYKFILKYQCIRKAVRTIINQYLSYYSVYRLFGKLFKNKDIDYFDKDYYNNIISDLDNKNIHKIFIIGYSFGGYIISKLAEKIHKNFNSERNLDKLNIVTFGSIYSPPEDIFNNFNFNFKMYMSISDVSLKSNHIVRDIIKRGYNKGKYYNLLTLKDFIPYGKLCLFEKENESKNLIIVCLNDTNSKKPLCGKDIIDVFRWKKHVSYLKWKEHLSYMPLFYEFIYYLNIDIYDIYKKKEDKNIIEVFKLKNL